VLLQVKFMVNRSLRVLALLRLLLGVLVGLVLEDTAVIDPADVFLAQDAVFRP